MTKTYQVYIKSHCEAPDFEYEVEADNPKEAIEKIQSEYDLGDREIIENMVEL